MIDTKTNPAGTGSAVQKTSMTNIKNSIEKSKESQAIQRYADTQKHLVSMSFDQLKREIQELKKQGYSRANVQWSIDRWFIYSWVTPEITGFYDVLAEVLNDVYGFESKHSYEDRVDYWTAKKHPNAELAAVSEICGSSLNKNLHQQAEINRGEIPDVPDARLIVQRCLQIGKQIASRGRKADEPTWFATLKVLAVCEPDLTRDASDGHPKFSEQEFQAKLARIRDEGLRPATCNLFNNINPSGCVGCTFTYINSPMALAYQALPGNKSRNRGGEA